MDDQTVRLRRAVHHDFESVHEAVNELSDRIHQATDIHEQVRRHPMAALAIAAVAGLVIGKQMTSLLGLGGVVALGARAALRATPPSRAQVIAERVVNGLSSALISAVLVPVVSGIQRGIESARALKSSAGTDWSAAATDRVEDGWRGPKAGSTIDGGATSVTTRWTEGRRASTR